MMHKNTSHMEVQVLPKRTTHSKKIREKKKHENLYLVGASSLLRIFTPDLFPSFVPSGATAGAAIRAASVSYLEDLWRGLIHVLCQMETGESSHFLYQHGLLLVFFTSGGSLKSICKGWHESNSPKYQQQLWCCVYNML